MSANIVGMNDCDPASSIAWCYPSDTKGWINRVSDVKLVQITKYGKITTDLTSPNNETVLLVYATRIIKKTKAPTAVHLIMTPDLERYRCVLIDWDGTATLCPEYTYQYRVSKQDIAFIRPWIGKKLAKYTR